MYPELVEVCRHLVSLGYTLGEPTVDGIRATKPKSPGFLFFPFYGSVVLVIWHTARRKTGDRVGLLEVINGLNAEALVTRYHVDEDNDVSAQAYYSLPYEHAHFQAFMEQWDYDLEKLYESDLDKFMH